MDVTRREVADALDDLRVLCDQFGNLFAPPLKDMGERVAQLEGVEEASGPQRAEHLRAMAGLCDELLTLSREFGEYAAMAGGDAGRQVISPLSSLVAEIDRRYASRARSRGLAWSCALVGPDADVTLDVARFHQLAARMLGFALNATPAGAALRFEAQGGDSRWRCDLLGIGPGTADESIERAFAPLHRIARPSTDEAGEPSSLTMCRLMVEGLGGTFEVRATADQGHAITIRLPLA